jgi:hypothetical protein
MMNVEAAETPTTMKVRTGDRTQRCVVSAPRTPVADPTMLIVN